MKSKLRSRKFWICVAAFLGSIGMSIMGLHTERAEFVAIGTVASVMSAAIYAACEAWVDAAAISNKEENHEGN